MREVSEKERADAAVAPPAAGERRQVTVLFADMAGYTSIAERLGEEGTYDLMQSIFAIMAKAVREQGGLVQDFTGDGIMAIFGVPVALEDAPLRACRAALAIQDRLTASIADIERKHGVRPQMRVGVNTGPVVVGQIESGRPSVSGDTVNFAARLQTLAEPGTVALSEAAHRQVQGLIESKFAGEHGVKGKSEPQKVFRLNAIREGAARFDTALSRGLTTYVGRDREVEILQQAIKVPSDRLRVVDIVAEAGMGKSRLLHQFREWLGKDRAYVLSGGSSPDGRTTPFLLFIEVVRGSFRLNAGEPRTEVARKLDEGLAMLGLGSPENLGLLLNLLGLNVRESALEGLDGTMIGLRTRDLLLQLLQARSRLSPVVLILEDLHWIDGVSEEVLGRIIAGHDTSKVLVLHTRRPDYRPPWADATPVTTLALEPLSPPQISELVRARLGVDVLPESLAELVAEKADGNALFAEEIAAYLIERGVVRDTRIGLEYDPATIAQILPASVQSLLTARVDRLEKADLSLLQGASVIGRSFDPGLLRTVMGSGHELESRLSEMQALDLVYRDAHSGDCVFKHALVRDALYASLLRGPREQAHLKVAEAIEQRSHNRLIEVAEILAHHYSKTDRIDKACSYLIMAGKKSLGVYSLDNAKSYLQKALALDSDRTIISKETFLETVLSLQEILALQTRYAEVAQIYATHKDTIEAFGTRSQIVRALHYHGVALVGIWDFKAADEVRRRAMSVAAAGDEASKAYARGLAIFVVALLLNEPFETVEAWKREAIEYGSRSGDNFILNWAYIASAWDYMHRGLVVQARDACSRLIESGHQRNDPRALGTGLFLLGWVKVVAEERYDEALLHAQESFRVSIAPFDRSNARNIMAICQMFRGDLNNAGQLLFKSRQDALDTGWTYQLQGIDPIIAVWHVFTGQISAGIRSLQALIRTADASGYVTGSVWDQLLLAEIYLEILTKKERPPVWVVVKNLGAILKLKLTWKGEIARVLDSIGNKVIEGGSFQARLELFRGIYFKLCKNFAAARGHLEKARALALPLGMSALASRADTVLAELD